MQSPQFILHNLSLIILGDLKYKEDEYLRWTESKGNENSISYQSQCIHTMKSKAGQNPQGNQTLARSIFRLCNITFSKVSVILAQTLWISTSVQSLYWQVPDTLVIFPQSETEFQGFSRMWLQYNYRDNRWFKFSRRKKLASFSPPWLFFMSWPIFTA